MVTAIFGKENWKGEFGIWKWKGEFEHSKQDELCPSDAESKEHYERCFNPPIS